MEFPRLSREEYHRFMKKSVTSDEAASVASTIGIHWDKVKFTPEEFRRGMEVEYEHGSHDPETNVTNNDPLVTHG